MLKKDLTKLLEQNSPKKILNMHCNLKITLNNSQIAQIIKLKNEKEGI